MSAEKVGNVARAVVEIVGKLTDALLDVAAALKNAHERAAKRQDLRHHIRIDAGRFQPIFKVTEICLPGLDVAAELADRALAAIALRDTQACGDPAGEKGSPAPSPT